MSRPQYQFGIFWMKFHFKEFLKNFNILPFGLDENRPIMYKTMLELSKKISVKYLSWVNAENERRKIKYDEKLKKNVNKDQIQPFIAFSDNFLKNSGILSSKLIYKLFLIENSTIKNLDHNLSKSVQEYIYTKIHKIINSSKVRLTNYKLLHHGLPTNSKFKNRYDKNCFMCKRVLNENTEHIYLLSASKP